MKKMSKFLAVLMSVMVFASVFAIVPSAISSTSSAKDILRYYEQCNIDLSAKEDIIKAENTTELSVVPDYSSLSAKDKEETLEMYGELAFEDVTTYNLYFYCDAFEDYYVDGRSEFIDYFSVNRDIKNWGLKFKSAKYSQAKNGDSTVTFVCTEDYENGDVNTLTYTAKFNKNGYILSYALKQVAVSTYESAQGKNFKVTETVVDSYKFVYNKIGVTGIELPETYIELEVDEEYLLEAVVSPSNASFKDFYISDYDADVVDYYEENGKIYLFGVGSGTTTVQVCTYDGDFVAELEVKVTGGSFFDRIIAFFANLFELLFGFLMF